MKSLLKGLSRKADGLAKRASRAGTRFAGLSEEGAVAARLAAGRFAASSRKTIERIKREWNAMDSARKATFVAALLGALAAASGSIVARKKK